MELTKKIIRKLLTAVKTTKPEEIGCDDCFEELQIFVELELSGNSMQDAKPLVQDHLERCKDCKEEYQVLLAALNSLYNSP